MKLFVELFIVTAASILQPVYGQHVPVFSALTAKMTATQEGHSRKLSALLSNTNSDVSALTTKIHQIEEEKSNALTLLSNIVKTDATTCGEKFCVNGVENGDFVIGPNKGITCDILARQVDSVPAESARCEKAMQWESKCCPPLEDSCADQFCPNGMNGDKVIDPDSGLTCAQAQEYFLGEIPAESQECMMFTPLFELSCCPIGDSCADNFCPNGITFGDREIEEGITCNTIAQDLPFLDHDSEECMGAIFLQFLCCPEPIDDPCSDEFCPDGMDGDKVVDPESGMTCDGVKNEFLLYMPADSDECVSFLSYGQQMCCPSPIDDSCADTFCPNGMNGDTVVDPDSGMTCDQAKNNYLIQIPADSDECEGAMMSMQYLCCPDSIDDSCAGKFCPDGMNEDTVIDPDTEFTCDQAKNHYLPNIPADSDECEDALGYQLICCPNPVADSCADNFCPDGMNGDTVVDPNSGMTCEQAKDNYLNQLPADSDECEEAMGMQYLCCPNEPECFLCGGKDIPMNDPQKSWGGTSCAELDYYVGAIPKDQCDEEREDMFEGVSIQSFCGCEGAEAPPGCNVCSEEEELNKDALVPIEDDDEPPFTCGEGAEFAKHVTSEKVCRKEINTLEVKKACCIASGLFVTDGFENGQSLFEGRKGRKIIGNYAYEGEHSMKLTNRNKRATTVEPIDVTGIDKVNIGYKFHFKRLDKSKGFILRFSLDNGVTWTAAKYIRKKNLKATKWHKNVVTIDTSSSLTLDLQFQFTGKLNNEAVFIDNVIIDDKEW